MDEKEKADRMAAAEALYMISTRVEKSGPQQKAVRRGRKKKNTDYVEDIKAKRKGAIEKSIDVTVNTSSRRGRSKRIVHEGRGASGSRGGARGAQSGISSPRSRSGSVKSSISPKGQVRQSGGDFSGESSQNKSYHTLNKRNSTGAEKKNVLPENNEALKQKSRSRTTKVRNQRTKSNASSNDYVDYSANVEDIDDESSYQAIGFTGASISINESSNKRSSVDSFQNLQSQGLVSGFRQVNLTSTSRSLSSTATVFGLPSMNLTSFTADLNLPSIPLEFGSLQLSSQPTPNLSSLGDITDGVMEDDYSSAARKKSEKFLPLKKRKLHNPSEAEIMESTPLIEASLSDSEERPEAQLSPLPVVEPIRASFTVQAPPIITMQTLMEIKTALTADDDGDLPLHIAVVHENMRMVIKLINLMRIAGKGVDKFNKQQQTPLHLAVKLNFLEAIDILLKSNANINAVDCTGSSCIHMAVQGRSTECLTLLLERCPHADLNARNFDGLTPLHIAVDNGDLHQVETLLKYNADIDVTDGKSGRTALFRAAESNQKAMVELLLGKGANPDVPNYAGVTTAMAAQGRNLHGVLKLLGSAATDKFTEYDTKPSGLALESKLYLSLPSSDSVTGGINLSKCTEPELTYLTEPKISASTPEMSSDETKVFHNVFVVSQSKDKNIDVKSKSEPASPEVKMEVIEDKDRERIGQAGLMSLPAGIFCNSEEQRGDKMFIRQRSVDAVQQDGSLKMSQTKLYVPISYSKLVKNTVPVVQKNEQKSIMSHSVPQSISFSASRTVAGTLALSSSTVTSDLLSRSSKPISSAAYVPSSSNDTVTLTGMQARLFQMLLKMYNIDPSNEISTSSTESWPSSLSPKSTIPMSSLTPSLSTTIPFYQKQESAGNLNIHQNSKNTAGFVVSALEESQTLVGTPHNQIPLSQLKPKEVGISYSSSSENGFQKGGDHEKVDESPLNLSKTSNRHDKSNKGSLTPFVKKLDTADSSSKTVHSSPATDSGITVVTGIRPGLSPVHFGSKGKVISIGVRRISDSDKNVTIKDCDDGQFEVFFLPTSEHSEVPVTASTRHLETANLTTIPARTVRMSSISQDKSVAKQPEHKHSVEITQVPDNHNITTSISQKTASIVRDYLSQQNQIRFQNLSASPLPSSAPHSPIQASVPAVLSFAAETGNSLLKKNLISLNRSQFSHGSTGKASPLSGSPVSSAVLLPAVSTSPIFLHQGQVIDLSRGKVTESSMVSTTNQSSLLSSDSGQGKIIGFSGAILSVVPPTSDRLEKRLPKEITLKELPKKRGRKGQKSVESSTPSAESVLGKINSETDEKLKKFLGARKIESAFAVSPDTVDGILGQSDEKVNGVDLEESESQEDQPRLSEGKANQTYKTVGIFSGNVQHVKYGKKLLVPPSLTNITSTLTLSQSASSPTISSSIDNKLSDSSTPGNNFEDPADNTGITVVSSLVTKTTDTAGLSCNRQTFLKTATNNTSKSCTEINDNNEGNFTIHSLDSLPEIVDTNLSVSSELPGLKKSESLLTPSLFVVIESRDPISTVLDQQGQSSQPEIVFEKNSDTNSSSFVSGKFEKLNSSKIKKQMVSKELNSPQDQKIKSKNTSLPTMKCQEVTGNIVQNVIYENESSEKEIRQEKKKKSELQRHKQIKKSFSVHSSQQCLGQSAVVSGHDKQLPVLSAETDHNQSTNIIRCTDNQKVVFTGEGKTEILHMEVDDDYDEPPNLCIEESEVD